MVGCYDPFRVISNMIPKVKIMLIDVGMGFPLFLTIRLFFGKALIKLLSHQNKNSIGDAWSDADAKNNTNENQFTIN